MKDWATNRLDFYNLPHLHRKRQVCLFYLHLSYTCIFLRPKKKAKSIVLAAIHLTQLTGGHEVETKRMAPRAGNREAGWCRRLLQRDGWDSLGLVGLVEISPGSTFSHFQGRYVDDFACGKRRKNDKKEEESKASFRTSGEGNPFRVGIGVVRQAQKASHGNKRPTFIDGFIPVKLCS